MYLIPVKQNFPPVCRQQRLKTGNGGRVRGEELAELLLGGLVMGCAVCCVIGVRKRAVLVGQRCTAPGGEARGAFLQTQEVGRDGGCQGAPCYPSTDTGCPGGWCCSRGLWCSPAAGPGAPRGMFCVLGHALLLVLPALCAQLIPCSSRRAPARLLGGAVPTARQSVLDKRPPRASRAPGALAGAQCGTSSCCGDGWRSDSPRGDGERLEVHSPTAPESHPLPSPRNG